MLAWFWACGRGRIQTGTESGRAREYWVREIGMRPARNRAFWISQHNGFGESFEAEEFGFIGRRFTGRR
jgi:hypothetical protein